MLHLATTRMVQSPGAPRQGVPEQHAEGAGRIVRLLARRVGHLPPGDVFGILWKNVEQDGQGEDRQGPIFKLRTREVVPATDIHCFQVMSISCATDA